MKKLGEAMPQLVAGAMIVMSLFSKGLYAQTVTIKVKDNVHNYYFPSIVAPGNRINNLFNAVDTVSADSTGLIRIRAAQYPYYKFSNTIVYIEPGDTLTLDLTQVRYAKSIGFEGPQAAANQWMHQHLLSKYLPLYAEQVPPPEESYASYRHAVLENKALVEKELNAIAASPSFKKDAIVMVNILAIGSLIRYYELAVNTQGALLQQKLAAGTTDSAQLTAGFQTWKEQYYAGMHDSIIRDVETLIPAKYEDYYNDRKETFTALYALKQFDSSYFAKLVLPGYDDLERVLLVASDDNVFYHTDFAKLDKQLTTPVLKTLVQSWHKKYGHLVPGKKAIDWEMMDEKGNKLKLSSLKGKAVYIDIWATWCNPCVALKPYFESLANDYKDQSGVQFVAISVDRNVKLWQTFLNKHNNGNSQVKQYIITDPRFMERYQIAAIPRFMLFDGRFNILDVRAPQPTNRAGIDEMLKKI